MGYTTDHPCDRSKLHSVYIGIKKRCCQKGHSSYPSYGGRGITICDEWKTSYFAFRKWAVANGYQEHLTINRIDSSKGYSPDNCEWLEPSINFSRGTPRTLTAWGETKTYYAWAKDPRCCVSHAAVVQRVFYGWEPEKILTTPARKRRAVKPTNQLPFTWIG